MALKLLQPGVNPLGQFDGYDSEVLSLKGGEVVTFYSVSVPDSDLAAFDAIADGYVNPAGVQKRPVVRKLWATGKRPLMLADEGISGYGTLFGSVVGGTVGQVTAGAVLGPHTATGSGKVTCWDKPGLYAVTLDAVDTNASTGLQPTNTSIDAGAALYVTSAGLLTPTSGSGVDTTVVARFVSFETNGSLVTTPNYMVQALNSPSGAAAVLRTFAAAVIHFNPPVA